VRPVRIDDPTERIKLALDAPLDWLGKEGKLKPTEIPRDREPS
jgi:hypothetical protein